MAGIISSISYYIYYIDIKRIPNKIHNGLDRKKKRVPGFTALCKHRYLGRYTCPRDNSVPVAEVGFLKDQRISTGVYARC